MLVAVAQLVVGEGLEGHTATLLVFAYEHRQPSQLVPGGDDAFVRENEDGGGAVDELLGVEYALHQAVLLVYEPGYQLRGIDCPGAHGHELVALAGEVLLYKSLGVVDYAHGGDGVEPQVRTYQQGLGVGVADAADAAAALEIRQVVFKL